MLHFDYSNQQCPYPVVETRKQLMAHPGESLSVQVGDQTARDNITRLANGQGYSVSVETTTNGFALTLVPGKVPHTGADRPGAAQGETVLFCKSDRMGEGDEELGRILLKNFFITLTDLPHPPERILFVNSGVKLVCRGSDILEALNQLACLGSDIAACGLCLEYYRLKDQLAVGRTTNMLEIAESQLRAGRIITP